MFQDAGELLRITTLREAHAIGFDWMGFRPEFRIYTGRSGVSELGLSRLFIEVGEGKTCVGRYSGEDYMPCPGAFRVEAGWQCPACAKSFIPQLSCIFEPRCKGNSCPEAVFCRREHKVYLAFYGTNAKLGMTSTRRLLRRVIEQGADAYAIIATVANRFDARALEKKISSDMKLRQYYRTDEIVREIRPVDKDAVKEKYANLQHDIATRTGYRAGTLSFLDGYPFFKPLLGAPELVDTVGLHSGEVAGIKGKLLFYENDAGTRALNLSDVVARKIRVEI